MKRTSDIELIFWRQFTFDANRIEMMPVEINRKKTMLTEIKYVN